MLFGCVVSLDFGFVATCYLFVLVLHGIVFINSVVLCVVYIVVYCLVVSFVVCCVGCSRVVVAVVTWMLLRVFVRWVVGLLASLAVGCLVV